MLYEKIKELRLASKMSQVELASKLGITKQCISNWENDNIQPSIDMLIKLANLFNVSTDYLLGLTSNDYIDVTELSSEDKTHIKYIIDAMKKKNINKK